MATAEELLNSEEIAARTFSINSDLRTLTPPANFKVFGVESDDDVARVYFKGPRYYKGADLSKFRVRVNILNANSEPDGYSVDDLQVDNITDTIIFSWLIGRNTAQYGGEIRFSLCFRELDSNAYVVREFNTTIATGKILEGLETSTLILQKYPDLIDNIILRLESLEENGLPAVVLDKTLSVENMAADAKAVGDALAELSVDEQLVVLADLNLGNANYNSSQIIEHLNNGGSVVLKMITREDVWGYIPFDSVVRDTVVFVDKYITNDKNVATQYVVDSYCNLSVNETVNTGMSEKQEKQLQDNTDAIAKIQKPVVSGTLTVETQKYTITLTMEDDTTETHILETDENNYPTKLTINGREIQWAVEEV